MPEISSGALDPFHQKLAANARAALERGQFDYVIAVCAEILKIAPGCLPVRRLQRAAQLRAFPAKPSLLSKTLGTFSAARFRFGAKEPARLLAIAERLLGRDPRNVSALKLLAAAARGLGFPGTTAFALDAIREFEPGNRANLLALGEALLVAGKPSEALEMADVLLREQSSDAAAQALMRRSSIAQTVTKGKWEELGTFHDKLRR